MKETIFGKGIPAIPMMRALAQFAASKKLNFSRSNWESVKQVYILYNQLAASLN